jgi:hypothetical protein
LFDTRQTIALVDLTLRLWIEAGRQSEDFREGGCEAHALRIRVWRSNADLAFLVRKHHADLAAVERCDGKRIM